MKNEREISNHFRVAIHKWMPITPNSKAKDGYFKDDNGVDTCCFSCTFSDAAVQKVINTQLEKLSLEEKQKVQVKDNEIIIGNHCLRAGTNQRARLNFTRFIDYRLSDLVFNRLDMFSKVAPSIDVLNKWIRSDWESGYKHNIDLPEDEVPSISITVNSFADSGCTVTFIKFPDVVGLFEPYCCMIVHKSDSPGNSKGGPLLYTYYPVSLEGGILATQFSIYRLETTTRQKKHIQSWINKRGITIGSEGYDANQLQSLLLYVMRPSIEVKEPYLLAYTKQLGKLGDVTGRETETHLLNSVMMAKNASIAVIVGEPGVGKTFVVEKFAQNNPSTRVLMVTMPDLSDSTHNTNDVLKKIFQEASVDGKTTLFLREVYPFLDKDLWGGVRQSFYALLRIKAGYPSVPLILELTFEQWKFVTSKFPEITEYAQDITVNEPPHHDVITILDRSIVKLEKQLLVSIEKECAESAVHLTNRFQGSLKLPGKALRLIERACSYKTSISKEKGESSIEIKNEDLEAIAKEIYGVTRGVNPLLKEMSTEEVKTALSKRVFAQDNAIEKISRSITRARAGLKPENKPIGVFLLAGSTGVGKTEIAKALADLFYGSEDSMVRYDMSEFYNYHVVARLLGSPVGYIGSEKGGEFVEKMVKNPYRVVLLDEFEKADPKIQDIFLQVFDDARLTDMRGTVANFSDSIIIMTTNLGAKDAFDEFNKKKVGFSSSDKLEGKSFESSYETSIQKGITKWLRPEFIARAELIVLKPLSKETGLKILQKILNRTNNFLKKREITVEVSEALFQYILDQGFSAEKGARFLERAWEDAIGFRLSEKLVEGNLAPGTLINFSMSKDREIEILVSNQNSQLRNPANIN